MTGVDPSVITAHEIVHHAMRIAVFKRSNDSFFAVSFAIAIAIRETIHTRDTIRHSTVEQRINPDGNVERVAEVCEFVRFTIPVSIFQNCNAVTPATGFGSEWILI